MPKRTTSKTYAEQLDAFMEKLAKLASFKHANTWWRRLFTKMIHIAFLFSFSHFIYVIDIMHDGVNVAWRVFHVVSALIINYLICEWDYLVNIFEINYKVLYLCILLMECILIIVILMMQQSMAYKCQLNFHKIPCFVRESFPHSNGYYNVWRKCRRRFNWFCFYIVAMFVGKLVLNSMPGFMIWMKFVFLVYLLDFMRNTKYYGICLDSVIILLIFASCVWNVQIVLGIVYFMELLQNVFIVSVAWIVFTKHLHEKDAFKRNMKVWEEKTCLREFVDFFDDAQR